MYPEALLNYSKKPKCHGSHGYYINIQQGHHTYHGSHEYCINIQQGHRAEIVH